ncbi:hypothetical protein FKM82_025653, partial [Ascaphus truei]
VGIVPPRTKSPSDEGSTAKTFVVRRGGSRAPNGHLSRERPKSALFPSEVKAKMSVEEQIDRMKRHQSGSMKEKRRSLQLPANQQPEPSATKPAASYRVVSPGWQCRPPEECANVHLPGLRKNVLYITL